MKKIGFIDYYLNEWHADHYPDWIAEKSNGNCKVCYAWAMIEPPFAGRISNREWAAKQGITLCDSIEQVVEQSDAVIVLSPDNAEMHESLSQIALTSGKPVFIDKTFTNDAAAAKRIFALAEAHHTPCYSSSALRYAAEYAAIDRSDITSINSVGGGSFDIYLIHQLEPIVLLMGSDAKQVIYTGSAEIPALTIQFCDGRFADIALYSGGCDFMMTVSHGTKAEQIRVTSDFFLEFIAQLTDFLETGEIKVSHRDTTAIMAIREACIKARSNPNQWISVDAV